MQARIKELSHLKVHGKSDSKANDLRNEGNSFYKKGKYFEALLKYNESLCRGSENASIASLAYANRSAVFIDMMKYEQCLENIEMAVQGGYPTSKLASLTVRKEKCLKLMKEKPNLQFFPKDFFKLSYPANKKLPFIIDSIEMRENKKYGRHLITTRPLKAGDIILIEQAISSTLDPEKMYTRCINCCASNEMSLIPCSGCSEAMFCSEKCRQEGTKNFHQFECGFLGHSRMRNEHARMCFEALSAFGSIDELKDMLEDRELQTKSIFDFDLSEENDPERDKNIWRSASTITRTFNMKNSFGCREHILHTRDSIMNLSQMEPWKSVYKSKKDQLTLKFIFEKFDNFRTTQFGMRTAISSHIVYPVSWLFNHSCFPNVNVTYFDNKAVHWVTMPIGANQQLFCAAG